MKRRPLRATMILVLCVACAPPTPEAPIVSVVEIDSPAGPGAAEPFLSTVDGTVLMSWLEEAGEGTHALKVARLADEGWSEPETVATSDHFFVNWADFPSVQPSADGVWWAHWLERGTQGGYDYAVRVVRSRDEGRSWSDPWTPHEDGTPTEHGFVALVPDGGGMGMVWLDGRNFAPGSDGEPGSREMTLRFRQADDDGTAGPEILLDPRTCDCCQNAAVATASGLVVVYRNRSEEEIRDIYVSRRIDGVWTEGASIHEDGWEIDACPVNGPAIDADGDDVVVAWFTGAEGVPKVKVAFSADGGASFGPPVGVDDGNPSGRVDVLHLEGGALVSWLERTGEGGAEVRVKRIGVGGETSGSGTVTLSSEERASGFPKMVRTSDGRVLVAWTDVSNPRPEVRVTTMEIGS